MDFEAKEILRELVEINKDIVHNSRPKENLEIILSSNETDFATNFNPPIYLERDRSYSVALVNLESYNSVPNIEEGVNNEFRYSPDNGLNFSTITFDTGAYELKHLNNLLFEKMKVNGHYDSVNDVSYINLTGDTNTLKAIMEIENGYVVDFRPNNSLREMLGFESQLYSDEFNQSTNPVDIMRVNTWLIKADIISGSYLNGKKENVLYSFYPNVSPGYKVVERAVNLSFLRINQSTISSMRIKITDQDGKLLDLRGEKTTIRLHIKED